MTRAETSVAAALGAPAWTFAHLATRGVQAKTADGHENMFTRLHPDGDEAAFASLAEARKTDRSERSLEKAGLDQSVGSRAGAIISAVFDSAVPSTTDIRAVLEKIRSVDQILDLGRQAGRAGSLVSVKADAQDCIEK